MAREEIGAHESLVATGDVATEDFLGDIYYNPDVLAKCLIPQQDTKIQTPEDRRYVTKEELKHGTTYG